MPSIRLPSPATALKTECSRRALWCFCISSTEPRTGTRRQEERGFDFGEGMVGGFLLARPLIGPLSVCPLVGVLLVYVILPTLHGVQNFHALHLAPGLTNRALLHEFALGPQFSRNSVSGLVWFGYQETA